jgi:hypothetical protein
MKAKDGWREFNLFTAGHAMSRLPFTDGKYADAKLSTTYAAWPFPQVLDERLRLRGLPPAVTCFDASPSIER